MVGGAEIGLEQPSNCAATAPRISIKVFTGKNGFDWNFVMLWRCRKRLVSSALYSGLFLIPRSESNGDMLPVAL